MCQIIGGSTPKTNIKENWGGDSFWITPAELQGDKWISSTSRTITPQGIQSAHLQLLPSGTVLLSSRAPIGKVAITTVPMYCNQGFKNLVCSDAILNVFAYYFLIYKKDLLNKLGKGATFKEISKTIVGNIKIDIPALCEQHRIVNILDGAFEKIDKIKANAEKNLQQAKDLFQATQKDLFEIKEGWKRSTLNKICFLNKNQGMHLNLNYIGMENIESNTGKLLSYVDSSEIKSTTFQYDKGDVLYGRLRPYLKKVIIAPFEGCCSTEIYPIKTTNILNSYLKYWFLLDSTTEKINETCSGCRMPRANMKLLMDFEIDFPSISEQQKIVSNLDHLSEKVSKLQSNYNHILTECDALKQAFLRKAFNGEL